MKMIEKEKSNLKKNLFWNTIGLGLNSFTSLFFLVIVTRINGIENAGVFTLCFASACMLVIIGNYCGRNFQVTESRENVGDNEYIFQKIISCILMIICSVMFGIIKGYKTFKLLTLLLLCIYKMTESIAEVFYGIFQKNDRLDLAGKSMFIKSILDILMFFLIDCFTNNIYFSIISMILVNIILIFVFDLKQLRIYKEKNTIINYKASLEIFKYGFFTFVYTLLNNYIYNIPRYSIESVLNDEFQTIYSIIIMPATFVIIANSFIFSPVINKLSTCYKEKKNEQIKYINKKIILYTVLIGILAEICALFLGIPVLEFIYGINLVKYKFSLIIIIFGATLIPIAGVFGTNLLIMRKTFVQVLIYSFIMLILSIISPFIVEKFGIYGGFYSYIILTVLLFLLYVIAYRIYFRREMTLNEK